MSIARITDSIKGTLILTYAGNPITPEMNLNEPEKVIETLTEALNHAYNKLRDHKVPI
jgi:hypothetical protein